MVVQLQATSASPNVRGLSAILNPVDVSHQMYQLMADLYPICRSITGDGVRATLRTMQQIIPLEIHEVPTGTPVFDWTVPKEWNIQDAYIKNAQGETLVDFRNSNLHVVSYSVPVHQTLSFSELKEYLHTLPDAPQLIPYRTAYYSEKWGFCLSHEQFLQLSPDVTYEVCIDSTLAEGHLTYGEYYLPGESSDEILISCHTCHPSLCDDNLSGMVLATFLGKYLGQAHRRYSYRFIFIPGTIGSITWLARNEDQLSRIKHGLVLTCVGDSGAFTYKKSRQSTADIDRVMAHVLQHSQQDYEVIDFFPYGYDERQFCSPGFNLPMGCLMRSQHGQFPEYHTSADNLDFVQPQYLEESFTQCLSAFQVLEENGVYLNQNPKCEPQLGKRGLYKTIGGQKDSELNQMAILWVLNLSDGAYTLLDIAERSGIPFNDIARAAQALQQANLLQEYSNR
jgi:aminopeptidase-like protein